MAERIQALRKQKSLSQEALAAELNVTRQAVSKWERGESVPELDIVVKLSEIFEVSLDYLLKNQRSMPEEESACLPESLNDANSNCEEEAEQSNFGDHIQKCIWALAVVIVLGMGLLGDMWDYSWIVILVAFVLDEAVGLYRTGRFQVSLYTGAVVVFLILGFFDIVDWSQAWLVFIAAWIIEEIFLAPNEEVKNKKN